MYNNSTKKENRITKFIKNNKAFVIITSILLAILMIFSVNFTIIQVSGNSMEPTFYDGEILVSRNTIFSSLDRFDVVVYLNKQVPTIKRVIGLPGETIEYKNNSLYINGELITDSYSIGDTEDFIEQIDENCYYCLGDNRDDSIDSRVIGQIPKKDILSKVIN